VHRPTLADPVASGPTALLDVEELSFPLGTEIPTWDRTLWAAAWAGAGSAPVAAAALPAVSAMAGSATPRAFNVSNLPIILGPLLRLVVVEMPTAVRTAAAMEATAASRPASFTGLVWALAALMRLVTAP
jgi:hypothetical protein